jgi:heptosyltransferase I
MSLPLQSPPQSVCLLRLSAIGDVTHVVPIVRTLQHHWPETALTWIIGRTEAALVGDIPGVEFIVFDKMRGFSSYLDLHQKLKARRFDILLHLQVSFRASLASKLVHAPIRIGFDRSRAKNWQWLFVTHQIQARPRQHVLDGFLEFVRLLGIGETTLDWNIPIPEKAREKARQWLGDDRPALVINPSSSVRARNWRNWDAEAYARVAEHAAERYGLRIVLTGGTLPQEKAFAERISRLAQVETVNLVGRTSLKELLAVLDRADLVIAPDTGPTHMANAVGTPVIGLYASSNPDRTGPYCFRHLVANRYPEAVQKEFGKSVDEIPWGRRVRDSKAMSLIGVEDVTQKIDQVMVDLKK